MNIELDETLEQWEHDMIHTFTSWNEKHAWLRGGLDFKGGNSFSLDNSSNTESVANNRAASCASAGRWSGWQRVIASFQVSVLLCTD